MQNPDSESLTSLTQSYAAAGFGQSMGFGSRQALLMIDFAQAYFDPQAPLYANAESTRLTAIKALAAARECGVPVIHTRVEYTKGGADGGIFFRKIAALKVFEAGSEWGKFAEGLHPRDNELVVTKQYASAFFGTTLDSTLRFLGIDCVFIAGMSTSGCVRASAVDAIQLGFIPVVLSDAVGDRSPLPHQASLFDLQAKYADVVATSDFIAHCRKQT